MKKFVKGLAVLGVMASLVSCATKTDFATFKEKAEAAAKKESPYTKATVKGTSKSGSSESKINIKYSKGNTWAPVEKDDLIVGTAIALVVFTQNVVFYAGAEVEEATYYAGSTFKYECKDLTVKFNKYGQVTSYAGEGYNLTVSYSK